MSNQLDPVKIREDFPVLSVEVRPGVPLIYLDNAATSQKPQSVIETMNDYYRRYNANVHRGIHALSEQASEAYENARDRIAAFINANEREEVILTSRATESLNLVAYSWGLTHLSTGDVVLITQMEHHANIVPWQIICQRTGAELKYVPMTEMGTLDLEAFENMLDGNIKLVAFNHMSNVTGSIQPVKEMVAAAHNIGAVVVVDGAQSVPHLQVDVQDLDADFYAFSGHKMLGPTGSGVLHGKRELLDEMPPFMGGGDMIKVVSLEKTIYNDLPWKFEAGTPNIAEVIGLGAAVDYLSKIGMDNIRQHEIDITRYALERLDDVPGLRIVGPRDLSKRGGVVAMSLGGVHPHDVAQILDRYGIAVRAGNHCAQPAHQFFGFSATARASFYLYNTFDEVDMLVEALYRVKDTFGA